MKVNHFNLSENAAPYVIRTQMHGKYKIKRERIKSVLKATVADVVDRQTATAANVHEDT